VSFEACAALVERGDPERWRAAMTAPEPHRGGLMALYAFNLEIARAGYVVSEPMMGEIRLRWWGDAMEEIYAGGPARRHEVATPLAKTIRAGALPREPFDVMIEARSWDCGREPFADRGELAGYLEATGAGLMWLAARWLGALEGAEGSRATTARGRDGGLPAGRSRSSTRWGATRCRSKGSTGARSRTGARRPRSRRRSGRWRRPGWAGCARRGASARRPAAFPPSCRRRPRASSCGARPLGRRAFCAASWSCPSSASARRP
jgi:hypothetical protein